jgi:acetyltransferase
MTQPDQPTAKVINRMLNARSVALVGASSDPRKYGYMTLETMIGAGFEGKIYPINPKAREILGLKAYRSLSEVPGQIDVVMILIPVKFVSGVLHEAAEKNIPVSIITSAGFSEVGRSDLEDEILTISKQTGIRLLGPNVLGFNYLPNKLCAQFYPVITTRGPLTIISQSGSITNALTQWAVDEGLGICATVNLGNQVDLCDSDFIDFFANDENTKSIAMYVEGVKNGRRFLEAIGQAAPKKPIVIIKSGRSVTGQESAASHTASLASSHQVFSAACRQFGVIPVKDLENLYDCAKALATMHNPEGNRLLAISTSGGISTLAVDEAETLGLTVPVLPREFAAELEQLNLSPLASLSNPIDLAAIWAEEVKQVALLADQYNVADILLLIFGDPIIGAAEMVKHLDANIRASIAVAYMGGGKEEEKGRTEMQRAGIPVYPSPERAVRGISSVVRFFGYHQAPGKKEAIDIVLTEAEKKSTSDTAEHFILEPEAVRYLERYDIPYPEHGLARSAKDALEIADRLGYPVVLKIVSPDVIHKSDAGGVVVGLESVDQVRSGFKQIHNRVKSSMPGSLIEGVMVCKEAPAGLEVIAGAQHDSVFGATIMFGMGGIFTEVLRDVSFRVAPLKRRDAEEMVKEIKGYPLLVGARGHSGYDLTSLVDLLMSVSRLVTEENNIKEMDLNPVRLFKRGLMVLDARIKK